MQHPWKFLMPLCNLFPFPLVYIRPPWWLRWSVYNAWDRGFIPGLGRYPGERNGNPVQYSCLEHLRDRRAWQASPWGHTESDTTEWLILSLYFLLLCQILHVIVLLDSFSEYNYFKICLCYLTYQYFILSSYWEVFHCRSHPQQFVSLLSDILVSNSWLLQKNYEYIFYMSLYGYMLPFVRLMPPSRTLGVVWLRV